MSLADEQQDRYGKTVQRFGRQVHAVSRDDVSGDEGKDDSVRQGAARQRSATLRRRYDATTRGMTWDRQGGTGGNAGLQDLKQPNVPRLGWQDAGHRSTRSTSRTNDDGKGRQGLLTLNRSGTTTADDTHGDGAGQLDEGRHGREDGQLSRDRADSDSDGKAQDDSVKEDGRVRYVNTRRTTGTAQTVRRGGKTTAGDLMVNAKVRCARSKVRSILETAWPVRPDEDAVQLSGKWTVATKRQSVETGGKARETTATAELTLTDSRVPLRQYEKWRTTRRMLTSHGANGLDLIRDRADRSSNGTTSYTAGKIRYSDGKTVDTGRLGVRQERTMTARGVKAHSPLDQSGTTTVEDTRDDGAGRMAQDLQQKGDGTEGPSRRRDDDRRPPVKAKDRSGGTKVRHPQGQLAAGAPRRKTDDERSRLLRRGGETTASDFIMKAKLVREEEEGRPIRRIGAVGARSATHRDSLCWYFKTMRQLHGSSPILGEGSSATPVESSVLLQFRSRIQEHSRRTVGKLNTIRPSVTTTIIQTMVVLRGSGQPGQQERSVTTGSSRLTPLGRGGKITVCGASETDEPLPQG
ncbi:hypothetical protein CF319_g7250 [Tilletia indica]|nr:hypothetical protein CF319_g7250 [Tilletia indica]